MSEGVQEAEDIELVDILDAGCGEGEDRPCELDEGNPIRSVDLSLLD